MVSFGNLLMLILAEEVDALLVDTSALQIVKCYQLMTLSPKQKKLMEISMITPK